MAIYNKIDGSQIQEFDEEFILSNFGIHGVNELQKVRFEISRHQCRRLMKQKVYAWGRNNYSQLGLSAIAFASNQPLPYDVPLPKELEDLSDEILDIKCAKRNSFIFTSSGKLWATGNVNKEKKVNDIKSKLSQIEV